MKNFKKALIVFALIAALFVGIVTTAMASDASDTATDSTLEERKAALEAYTPISEYTRPVIVGPLTFESGTPETNKSNWTSNSIGQILGDVGVNPVTFKTEDDGNTVLHFEYKGEDEKKYEQQNSSLHTYSYINVNKRDATKGLVMEFDMKTDLGMVTGNGIEHATVTNDAGTRSQPRILDIKKDGSFVASYTGSACQSGHTLTDAEKANFAKYKFLPGEWLHFSIIVEPETGFVTLYVNYEYVARYDTRPKGVSNYTLSVFRFGSANGSFESGDFSIDNFIAYEGDYVRTVDLLTSKNDNEKFSFYVDYMTNPAGQVADRVYAYKTATSRLANYWDGEKFIPVKDPSLPADELAAVNAQLEASVTKYNEFVNSEYAALYEGYITDNLKTLGEKVAAAKQIDRTLATVYGRVDIRAEIDSFLENAGNDILMTDGSDYAMVMADYGNFCAKLDNDLLIGDFTVAVDRVYSALNFSVKTIQRHYNAAREIQLSIDPSVLALPGFDEYSDALLRFNAMGDTIDAKIREENAKRIVNCVSFISGYKTAEEWQANYDYINRYVVIIRDTVREDNFDNYYEGLADALAFYYECDAYFYGLLQDEHAATVRDLLDKYIATDGYVERVGICAHLENYLATEDIDFSREEFSAALIELDTYKAELEQYKTDYNNVLIQNTAMFANTIRMLTLADNYHDMLALYNQARDLYFAMNVGDESIAAELAIYDEFTEYFALVDASCTQFILNTGVLAAATTEDERFAALVDCYVLLPMIVDGYDGIDTALATYTAAAEENDAYATRVNAELAEVATSIGSVRANCSVGDIIAIIVKKVFD